MGRGRLKVARLHRRDQHVVPTRDRSVLLTKLCGDSLEEDGRVQPNRLSCFAHPACLFVCFVSAFLSLRCMVSFAMFSFTTLVLPAQFACSDARTNGPWFIGCKLSSLS